jgi:DNA helicase-2/ATP-dependent DNA helicase PcrA
MDFLNELNEPQKQAVINYKGPTMVIAGAGSGKTRVLTYRIAYLLQQNVDPFNILALTFTNKAAREMKERIAKVAGAAKAQSLWMGTFHSVFAKILRIEAEKIGYPNNFTIYDTADSKNLVKSIIKEMMLDDKIYKPGLVYNRISSAKNNLISAKAYGQNTDLIAEDRMRGNPRIHEIFAQYEMRCYKAGAMDFDDLLFKTNILLRDFPEVLYKYQHKFHYILVDEYQDTNFSQYLIIKKLAALNENICVVGDDAQSIYAFRGANIQNILNFKKDYPDVKIFKLEQNYRSTKVIVEAANSIISKNEEQLDKKVWTANAEGDKIKVVRANTDNEEGQLVANSIYETRMSNLVANKHFAILYRTNAQSRSFEESLRKLNIPYRIYGGLSFYQRKEIKDLLAYFRLTANHNDEEALKRVINYPKRGIGDTTVDALVVAAAESQTSVWNVVQEPERYGVKLNTGSAGKLRDFSNMIKSFRVEMERMPAYDLASHVASSTGLLKELYDDKSPEGVSRYENIQELLNGIKEFTDAAPEGEVRSLADFLIDVALLTDADQDDPEGDDKVVLMTIHAAKGLEFPYVYIVGLEENLFPSQMSLSSKEDLEEERRLFYVALTRAEKRAQLSYALTRYRWGNLTHCEPSRFIEELDAKFLELPPVQQAKTNFLDDKDWGNFDQVPFKKSFGTAPAYKPKPATGNTPLPPKPKLPDPKNLKKLTPSSAPANVSGDAAVLQLSVGQNVMHEKFGKGKVIAIDGAEPNVKATVFFPSEGQKQLLLRFARLQVID